MIIGSSGRWFPINFVFTPTTVSVEWMDFGSMEICDPFFYQTIQRLRRLEPPAGEETTSLSTLLGIAEGLPAVQPAGVIFHVSRCGSTLLANVLRINPRTVALSEARPVGLFFRPHILRRSPFPEEGWDETRRMLLDAVLRIYGARAGYDSSLIIKCHAVNLLQMAWIRSVWPEVPFVILIRDPLEVMVSNFALPAGWMRWSRSPATARLVFGWNEREIGDMSIEEYSARGLGRFFDSIREALDQKCKLVDYSDLSAVMFDRIAEFIGLKVLPSDSATFTEVASVYSKDPTRSRSFERDVNRKRAEATDFARLCANRWARGPYELLRTRSTE